MNLQQMLQIQVEIQSILEKHNLTPREGEFTLLFLAGVSAGACQRPIMRDCWIDPTWLGWKLGASQEPVPEEMLS